ncbi:MAG TPA: hypothetical protein PLT63_01155 [Syntrophales bacterium]|jgi:hypothetical protein|nr:hypothetical protein [Syntrophales bacterium]HPL66174.1 hypothetical protein [Smithellaceae bacterium]
MRLFYGMIILLVAVLTGIAPECVFSQTVGAAIEQQLKNAGVDAKDVGTIIQGSEKKAGMSFNVPLYDRVDFATFPDARLNVTKLAAPAALVLTPQFSNYIFRGKSDSFQGSFRTYEFHLGEGAHKACLMIFPQVFEHIRGVSSHQGLGAEEVAIVPRLDEFRFKWGGTWTPVMSVTMKMSVGLFAQGRQIFEKTYQVEDIKEGTSTIFPNESQEYKAISKAMITVLTQAAREIAVLPVLLAYKVPSPPPAEESITQIPAKKIDMDAIVFLAGTWEKYRENINRLTFDERVVARRILRLKDAWSSKDLDRQQDEINFLIQIAKKLEPVSRNDLLNEIKLHKKWTDQGIVERNAAEDKIYNFAGDYTETVLDYAGLGIDLAKVGVLATGCLYSLGTICPALALTMSEFDLASTLAEGVGAATAEAFWKSGDPSKAVYEAAKASLVDFTAGKIGGAAVDTVTGKLALRAAQKNAAGAASEPLKNKIFVNTMELSRSPTEGLKALAKEANKRIATAGENMITKGMTEEKTLKPPPRTGQAQPQLPGFESLNRL